MKTIARALAFSLISAWSLSSFADDADADFDAFDSIDTVASSNDAAFDSTPSTPLACDGALCDTANGSGCSIGPWGATEDGQIFVAMGALLVVMQRQRARSRGAK